MKISNTTTCQSKENTKPFEIEICVEKEFFDPLARD